MRPHASQVHLLVHRRRAARHHLGDVGNRRRHRRKALTAAITPTEKIWMDGELVDLGQGPGPRAHPHHALRLGRLRGHPCLPTSTGVVVFRLRDHIDGCSPPPGLPSTSPSRRRAHRASREVGAGERLDDGLLHPPLVYLGYGEMGLNPMPPRPGAIAAWPWGTYLVRRGCGQRGLVQDQLLAAPRPHTRPTAARATGHVTSTRPWQGGGVEGRLRRGDPAHARREGLRVHGREHLRRPRRAPRHAAHLRRRPALEGSRRSRPDHRTRHGAHRQLEP